MTKLFEQILDVERVRYNEPLAKHTTFRIGGPADYLVLPESEEEIREIITLCKEQHIPLMVIGNGSNLLFDDKGFRGCIVQLADRFAGICDEEDCRCTFYAKAGTSLAKVANYACAHRLTGLEFASGIPGSVGGGVLMNAGAYGGELSQCVHRSRYLDVCALKTGQSDYIKTREGMEQGFSYRHSAYQEEETVILGAYFTLDIAASQDTITARMKELNARRREKQPLEYPSAGSAFKRPDGDFAARLIEVSGLKGLRMGDAMVSTKHSGFIVNVGTASAQDVRNLIEQVQEHVYRDSGIMLEPEIRIIKEDDGWNL